MNRANVCELGILFFFCFINQITCHNNEYLNRTYRCKSGEYVDPRYFCDGYNRYNYNSYEGRFECKDNSDESSEEGCRNHNCGHGKFNCVDGSCKTISAKCNTILDCEDGSDESNCGDEVDIGNCSMSDGKFLCRDRKRCLSLEYTCDRYCNCFDCSDENESCEKYDRDIAQKCSRGYIHTPIGPLCLCNTSNSEVRSLCAGTSHIENCTASSKCLQHCYSFRSRKYCSCYDGYSLVPSKDGFQCRSNDWFSAIVVYSTITKIKYLRVSTNRSFTLVTGVDCMALAAARDYVYYAIFSVTKNYIFKTRISDSNEPEKLIEWDSPITSIAVDYITNNIYFVANESLLICTNNGRHCTRLKSGGVHNVALAPASGLMFFTEKRLYSANQEAKHAYYLMKSNMDGSNETVFVENNFELPNISLTVDESTKKVLFLNRVYDRENYEMTLESTSFDETPKQTTYLLSPDVVSIAAYDHALFFNKKNDEILYWVDNYTELTLVRYDDPYDIYFNGSSASILKHLRIYNPLRQNSNNNPCAEDACPGLCFLRPTSSGSSPLTYTCGLETTSTQTNVANVETVHPKQNMCSEYKSRASIEHPKAREILKSNESSQNHDHFFINFMLFLIFSLLSIALAVCGIGGYFLFRRYLWDYYESLNVCKWNERDERVEMAEQRE